MSAQPPKAERESYAHWDYQKASESLVALHKQIAEDREQESKDCYRCKTMAQIEPAAKWHERRVL